MVKDQDFIHVVRQQDVGQLKKLISKAVKLCKNKRLSSSKKLNINYQDGDGMCALHQAALMGNVEIITLLLDYGAAVSVKDNKGMIPLHYASWQGKPEPVQILLMKGSPVNEPAQNGETSMHLACQHGHFDVVNLMLFYQADPTAYNRDHKTPLDLACEFGRTRVVDLLLKTNLCTPLLVDREQDMYDNNQTTCLHLAAKNGHLDIIRLLLHAGVNVNRTTLKGTCIHEAALYGKTDVVRLLLNCGVDVNRANSYDQTALDIVNKFTTSRAARELKHLLKEASSAVHVRAIKDHCGVDPYSLSFREGDIIKVVEQKADGAWKGYIINPGEGKISRTGYFPADYVVQVERAAAREAPEYACVKKAHQFPDLISRGVIYHGHDDRSSLSSSGTDEGFPPPPSPLSTSSKSSGKENIGICYPNHLSPHLLPNSTQFHAGRDVVNHRGDAEWPPPYCVVAGDMRASSPCKDSPAGSNRNSAASSDSGRGVSTGHLEPKAIQHNFVNVNVTNHHRLSGQSYESGVSSRQSYHSNSSSSLGSLDRLEESGYSSQVNIAELIHAGIPDHEVLLAWLRDIHFEEYYNHFFSAGYSMPTITRMTPEDLTAIGITKPGHRKRLKSEIGRLNIPDGIPDFKPTDVMQWLHLLGLEQYFGTLTNQGFDSIDYVTDITWEDLEDIGIKKLGHQKRIMIAIDKLKRITCGTKHLSNSDGKHGSQEMLEPPSAMSMKWPSDSTDSNCQDVQINIVRPCKSPSGDSLSTTASCSSGVSGSSSGSSTVTESRSWHSCKEGDRSSVDSSTRPNSYQPDVVAIQVKNTSARSSTSDSVKDSSVHHLSSFHAPAGRKTPTSEDDFVFHDNRTAEEAYDNFSNMSTVAVAPVAPRIAAKPRPIARIIAKTAPQPIKEISPEITEEKHESECNKEEKQSLEKPLKLHIPPPNKVEHIYDQPIVHSPKSPNNSIKPNGYSQQPSSPQPKSVTFVNNAQTEKSQPAPPPSVKAKKEPPPPPPKRTHSVRAVENYFDSKDKTATSPVSSVPPNSNQEVELKPQQQAFANCVKNLSAKFGKRREDEAAQDSPSSDGEEFPPPPPPIAMDIITPKIHNYGIPAKPERNNGNVNDLGVPNCIKREQQQAVNGMYHQNSYSPEVTFGAQLRRTKVSSPEPVSDSHVDKLSDIESPDLRTNKRNVMSNSTASLSSVDSNTLPFANEDVGTIKQKAPVVKASILDSSEHKSENNSVSVVCDEKRTINMGRNVSFQNLPNGQPHKMDVHTVKSPPVIPQSGMKPPVPNKPVKPSTAASGGQSVSGISKQPPPTKNNKSKGSADVLSDIDNMLQGLTEELDAMLETEMLE